MTCCDFLCKWLCVAFYAPTIMYHRDTLVLSDKEQCVIICLCPIFLVTNIIGMMLLSIGVLISVFVGMLTYCFGVFQRVLCPTSETTHVINVIPAPSPSLAKDIQPVMGIQVAPQTSYVVIGIPHDSAQQHL